TQNLHHGELLGDTHQRRNNAHHLVQTRFPKLTGQADLYLTTHFCYGKIGVNLKHIPNTTSHPHKASTTVTKNNPKKL
ncbi:hypothetical protein ACQWKP_23505, partial [Salmonella enterica subsp. enterica serovar Infantis]